MLRFGPVLTLPGHVNSKLFLPVICRKRFRRNTSTMAAKATDLLREIRDIVKVIEDWEVPEAV